jgi:hypothetical protein
MEHCAQPVVTFNVGVVLSGSYRVHFPQMVLIGDFGGDVLGSLHSPVPQHGDAGGPPRHAYQRFLTVTKIDADRLHLTLSLRVANAVVWPMAFLYLFVSCLADATVLKPHRRAGVLETVAKGLQEQQGYA